MAVAQVIRLQARPGRFGDLLERSQKLRKIRERLAPASKSRQFIPASGDVVGTLIVVLEFADWKEFGEYRDKLQNDTEARAMLQSNYTDRDPIVLSQNIELVREL
jgi:hypothetical protein